MTKPREGGQGVAQEEVAGPADLGPIVSSGHLASGAMPSLSEFEFGAILLSHAFERWMVRCVQGAGGPALSPMDVLVMHNVNHRGKPKRLADIALVLNVEDSHVVNYAVKKLASHGLVTTGRMGKEKVVRITGEGEALCLRYREVREALLVRAVKNTGVNAAALSDIAAMLRALSGHYDQAARAAASL